MIQKRIPNDPRRTAMCLAVLGSLLLASCSQPAQTAARERKQGPPPVAVVKVTRQDLTRDMELAAEFRPNQEIDVYAKLSGYLKAIHVDVGDMVRRGQLIAELEVPELGQDLVEAQASTRRSELDIQRAKGEVQRAEATYRMRKLSFDRLSSVIKDRPNLIAQQEIDDASALFHEAEAQLEVARANLASTEQQVAVANAKSARIGTMIDYLRITAPFSGVITQRLADPGAMIQAGTASHTQAMPVVRLSQVDHLRLILPVPESIASRIRIGTPVEIRVDSLNRIFQGKVSRFSNKLNTSTRTMETEVDVPNPGRALLPGMYGHASLKLERRDDALAVPVQAVSSHDTNPSVLVVNGSGTLEERMVVLGLETPERTEVVSGLKEDDLVVIGNRAQLKAGMPVEPKLIEHMAAQGGH
jgi:RND family efflux transporter MFP subunit